MLLRETRGPDKPLRGTLELTRASTLATNGADQAKHEKYEASARLYFDDSGAHQLIALGQRQEGWGAKARRWHPS